MTEHYCEKRGREIAAAVENAFANAARPAFADITKGDTPEEVEIRRAFFIARWHDLESHVIRTSAGRCLARGRTPHRS